MAVVTPLNNFLGPEGDTVTADKQLPKYQSDHDHTAAAKKLWNPDWEPAHFDDIGF